MSRVRVTVLGSGTLVPDDGHRSSAHLVEGLGPDGTDVRWALLLDCGFGTVHGMTRFGVDPGRLTHLALSHYHTDHIGDLAPLLFTFAHGWPRPRETPFTLLGPPGLQERLAGLARAHGSFVDAPPYPLAVVEHARSSIWEDPEGRFRLSSFPVAHTPEAVAWRVEIRGGPVVGYTGDTGPTPGLGKFLEGAELLIAECAFRDPPPWEGHLSPTGVAALAAEVRPRHLLLTHLYPDVDRAGLPGEVARAGWSGAVEVAEDGTRVVLG